MSLEPAPTSLVCLTLTAVQIAGDAVPGNRHLTNRDCALVRLDCQLSDSQFEGRNLSVWGGVVL